MINLIIIIINIYDVHQFPSSRISADLIIDRGYWKVSKSKEKNTKYLLKIPYSYDKAFDYIAKKNAKTNTLLLGTTYGFLPEVLQNYNYSELIKVISLRNEFDNISQANYSLAKKITKLNEPSSIKKKLNDYLKMMKKTKNVKPNNKLKPSEIPLSAKEKFSKLHKVKNLKYLLIADYAERKKISKILINNNWILYKKFEEKNYGSTLLLFKKIE